jgi:hypothetical protein
MNTFAASAGFQAPQSIYQTVTQPPPSSGPLEREEWARQIAASYREAGPLYPGVQGGGAMEGIDLNPSARRVLLALQVRDGMRSAGALTGTLPNAPLPQLHSYPPPYAGMSIEPLAGFAGYTSPLWPAGTPVHSIQASPYQTFRREFANGPSADAGGGAGLHSGSVQQRKASSNTDELFIPYSQGMLGSFSPYRGMPVAQSLQCFECKAMATHYGNECPARFARVRGEAPPGWTISGPGAVVKDPAAWNGTDLTAAARAAYAQFIRRLSLMAHSNYPVTIDEITGSAPVDPRRPLPRPVWSGRGK